MSNKEWVYLTIPILDREQFNILRKAGVIWFDPKMAKGHMYGFNIKKMIEIVENIDTILVKVDKVTEQVGEKR